MLIVLPLAHVSVLPIRALQGATSKSITPYQFNGDDVYHNANGDDRNEKNAAVRMFTKVLPWKEKPRRRSLAQIYTSESSGRIFQIPEKVPEKKHVVRDELTDLTHTFNAMSDELVIQYDRLEDRVRERTAELEQSKKAAEAANESKTLFIANISHELKTPLNGILGMCAVSMQEDDVKKVRQSLDVIYKSGDLLLHLLNDLLTFSKNSIGQQLSIDEREFRLVDVATQVASIFDKQAQEAQVSLKVIYQGTHNALGGTEHTDERIYGPRGTGRVRDMCLWGDKNRILQVLVNLVSNSLKFTPPGGSVVVKMRCLGLDDDESIRTSFSSRRSRDVLRPSQSRLDSRSPRAPSLGSSNHTLGSSPSVEINVAGTTRQMPAFARRQTSTSAIPRNTKSLLFEFEVEDTGPGVPEDQQQEIFKPFVQGDLGLSKKHAGTGLGLSICAQLANLMGGGMSLKSTVGVGSIFSMHIPLRFIREQVASAASSLVRHQSVANSLRDKSPQAQPMAQSHSKPASLSDASIHSVQAPSALNPEERAPSPRLEAPRIVGFSRPYMTNGLKRENSSSSTKKVENPPAPAKKVEDLKKAESEAAQQGRKVRVLVAEDNAVNQQVVMRMLKLEDIYGMHG